MAGFVEYNCGGLACRGLACGRLACVGLACVTETCVLFHVRTRVHREITA